MANRRRNKNRNKSKVPKEIQSSEPRKEMKELKCENSKRIKEMLPIKNQESISECKNLSKTGSKSLELTKNGSFGKKCKLAIEAAKGKSIKKGSINNTLRKRKLKNLRQKERENITSAETILPVQSSNTLKSNNLRYSVEKISKKDISILKRFNYDCLKFFPVQNITVGNLSLHETLFGDKTLNNSPLCDVIFENIAREDGLMIYSNEICLAYNLVLKNKSINTWQENMYFTLKCVKCSGLTFICQSIDALFSFKEPNHKILCDIYKNQQNYISIIYEGCFFPVLKVKNCNRCSQNFNKCTMKINPLLESSAVTETGCLISDRLQLIENSSLEAGTCIVNDKECDMTTPFIADNSLLPTNIYIKPERCEEENVGIPSFTHSPFEVNSHQETRNAFYPEDSLKYLFKKPIENSCQFCKKCYTNFLPKENCITGTCENMRYPMYETLILPQMVSNNSTEDLNLPAEAMLNMENNRAVRFLTSDYIKECPFTEESSKQLSNIGYSFNRDENSAYDTRLNDGYVYEALSHLNSEVDLPSSFLNNPLIYSTNCDIYHENAQHQHNSHSKLLDHDPKNKKRTKYHDTFHFEGGDQIFNASTSFKNIDIFSYPTLHLDKEFGNPILCSTIDSTNSSCDLQKGIYMNNNCFPQDNNFYCNTRPFQSISAPASICKDTLTSRKNVQNNIKSSGTLQEVDSVKEKYIPHMKNIFGKEDDESLINNCECVEEQSNLYQILNTTKSYQTTNQSSEHLNVSETFEYVNCNDYQTPSFTNLRDKNDLKGSKLPTENLCKDYNSAFQPKSCCSHNPLSFTDITWENPHVYENSQSESRYCNIYSYFPCDKCCSEHGTNNYKKPLKNFSRISDLSRLPIENKYAFRQYARTHYNSNANGYNFNRKNQYQNFKDYDEKFGWNTIPNISNYQDKYGCNYYRPEASFSNTCENFPRTYRKRKNFSSHSKSRISKFLYESGRNKNESYTGHCKHYRGRNFFNTYNNTNRWRGLNNPQERFFNAAVNS